MSDETATSAASTASMTTTETDGDKNKNNSSSSKEDDQDHFSEADRNHNNPNGPPIYRFVFTGGPCGGKTTSLARVFSFLRERGFEVITCPEAYTLLSSNGMSAHLFSTPGMPHYIQSAVFDTQMTLENSVQAVLKARGMPGVILCDRGSMDGTVYMDPKDFEEFILQPRKTDIVQVRDSRYDAVFHLVTAADGALPHYSLESNTVRSESRKEAIEVDRKTQKAWVGHPHLYVFDNSTDFEGKMQRLVDVISKIVGLPSNLRRRSTKFLLEPLDSDNVTKLFPADIHFEMFDVEKVYLQRNDDDENNNANQQNYSFVRKRSVVDRGSGIIVDSVYQSTTVTNTSDGEMIEQKRIITQREYVSALLSRDINRHIVRQRRISFLYKLQSFTIHIYQQPVQGLSLLHAQIEASRNNNCNSPAMNGNRKDDDCDSEQANENKNISPSTTAANSHPRNGNENNNGTGGVILPPFLKVV